MPRRAGASAPECNLTGGVRETGTGKYPPGCREALLRTSVIRRSFGFSTAFLLGHGLTYLLLLVANALLDKGGFGVFYVVVLTINVVMAPASAAMFALARYLAEINAAHGRHEVARITWGLLGRGFRWGTALALVISASIAVTGLVVGISAWPLALLVPLTALALALKEVVRTAFQSTYRFSLSSALWLVSQAAQFVLAIGGLAASGKVWAGILGIFVGASVATLAFSSLLAREARVEPIPTIGSPDLRKELNPVISYTLFTIISNLDVLIGYWILPQRAFDAYAASAVLPKALVTASLPIAQVALAVIAENRTKGGVVLFPIAKALGLFVTCAAAAAALLVALTPVLLATPISALHFDPTITPLLAAAAIAVGGLRIIVVSELAMHRNVLGYSQAGVAILFAVACYFGGVNDGARLAGVYGTLAWSVFVVGGVILMLQLSAKIAMPAWLRSH